MSQKRARIGRRAASRPPRPGDRCSRLCVEPVEPRLMLAAMSLSIAPVNEQFAQATMEVGQVNIAEGDMVRTMAPSEGGFISYTPTVNHTGFDGLLGLGSGVMANTIPRTNGTISLSDIVSYDTDTFTYVAPS